MKLRWPDNQRAKLNLTQFQIKVLDCSLYRINNIELDWSKRVILSTNHSK